MTKGKWTAIRSRVYKESDVKSAEANGQEGYINIDLAIADTHNKDDAQAIASLPALIEALKGLINQATDGPDNKDHMLRAINDGIRALQSAGEV
jgi:5-carboxymethyl-2-hydroxymuconate isomerase